MDLLQKEKIYLFRLHLILEHLGKPLRKFNSLDYLDLHSMLVHMETIYRCHSSLYHSLLRVARQWGTHSTIGDVFLRQTEWMGAHYAPYMCAYNVALHTRRLLPTVPEFQPLREEFEKRKEVGGMPLEAFLLLPIQRIPSYKRALKEMSRNTEEHHPDWQLLQAAINLLDRLLADLSSRARLIRTSTKPSPSSRPISS